MFKSQLDNQQFFIAEANYQDVLINSTERFTLWLITSTVFFVLLHHWISDAIFLKLSTTYQGMSWAKRIEWNARVTSFVHAAVVNVLSLICLFKDVNIWRDPLLGGSYVGYAALAISSGYMVVDAFSMPMYWKGKLLAIYWLHHGLVILAAYTIINFRIGVFFGAYRLLSELSTPFLNLRWLLRQSNYPTKSLPVVICTVTFAVSFFIGRLIPAPLFWIMFRRMYVTPDARYQLFIRPWLVPECLFIAGGLDCLNVVWSRSVLKLAWNTVAAYRKAKSSSPSSSEFVPAPSDFNTSAVEISQTEHDNVQYSDSSESKVIRRLENINKTVVIS